MPPLLEIRGLRKTYTTRGWPRRPTFTLRAELVAAEPSIIGVMGPNGSGKTTLFELITGGNRPTEGVVLCAGRDIHKVRYDQRDRLAIHHHQSYQVRRFRHIWPNFLLRRAGSDYPFIHLFDEPEFSVQDGYIGFMLTFFRRLRADGRLVFVCLHPTEPYHLEIMREICERFIFIQDGRLHEAPDWQALLSHEPARGYLDHPAAGTAPA